MATLNEIKHWGVLGMHWGVRKSRNTSADHNTVAALKSKHISELSDAELKKLSGRLELEKKVKDLRPANAILKSGVVKLLGGAASTIATTYIIKYGSSAIENIIKQAKEQLKTIGTN